MSKRVYVKKPAARKTYAKKAYTPRATYTRGYGDYTAKTKTKGASGYGRKLGKVLGEGADLLYNKFSGFGDYVSPSWTQGIKNNSILDMGLSPPEVVNTSMKNVIIRHREFISDITTGAAGVFTNRSYSINPGIPETFPWLSQIASSFEQYKMRGMIFEFKSTSADALNSTNTALGTVIMATEYDVSRPDFGSKQQMENHQYAMSARQSCSMLHPIECARSQSPLNELYIRNGDDAPTQDIRFSDFADFQIATTGQQGSSVVIGELWCSYEIELLKPRFGTVEGPANVLTGHMRSLTGISTTYPFGTTTTITGNLRPWPSGNTLQFPSWLDSGRFHVSYTVTGTSAALVAPNMVPYNCALVGFLGVSGLTQAQDNSSSSSITYLTRFVIDINGPNATLSFVSGTYPSSATSMDLLISSYNPVATVEEEEHVHEQEQEKEDDLIDQLLKSGKSVYDLQKMITERGFNSEKKLEKETIIKQKEVEETLTPKDIEDFTQSEKETVQQLIERVRKQRELSSKK